MRHHRRIRLPWHPVSRARRSVLLRGPVRGMGAELQLRGRRGNRANELEPRREPREPLVVRRRRAWRAVPPHRERRSLKLNFAATAREGVYALKRTWPTEGTWTLVIKANHGPEDAATAVVELGPDGDVAAIRVPTMQHGEWTVPAPVSLGDIDAALRARAATLARRS